MHARVKSPDEPKLDSLNVQKCDKSEAPTADPAQEPEPKIKMDSVSGQLTYHSDDPELVTTEPEKENKEDEKAISKEEEKEENEQNEQEEEEEEEREVTDKADRENQEVVMS